MKAHDSLGEATIIVLSGRVLLSAGSTSWDGRKGDLLVVPAERHSLEALMDTVVVLTTAKVRWPTALLIVWAVLVSGQSGRPRQRPSAAATVHNHASTDSWGDARN